RRARCADGARSGSGEGRVGDGTGRSRLGGPRSRGRGPEEYRSRGRRVIDAPGAGAERAGTKRARQSGGPVGDTAGVYRDQQGNDSDRTRGARRAPYGGKL